MNDMLALPPIPLAKLPERTKDFILGMCNGSSLTPEQVVKRVLDQAAGVVPPPATSRNVTSDNGKGLAA